MSTAAEIAISLCWRIRMGECAYRECDESCLNRNDKSMLEDVTMKHKLSNRRWIYFPINFPNLQGLGFVRRALRNITIFK